MGFAAFEANADRDNAVMDWLSKIASAASDRLVEDSEVWTLTNCFPKKLKVYVGALAAVALDSEWLFNSKGNASPR